jgi:hypothetical protein
LIKSYLKTSTFDLFDAWQAIKHAISNQLKELNYVRASQQIRIPLDISGARFEAIRGWISHPALRKVQEQRQLLLRLPLKACTSSFTSSYGLPCVHTLKQLDEENQVLRLEHFHPHWHLKRGTLQPSLLLEPQVVRGIQHQSRLPATSTRREPSGFELVQATKKAPSKCSRCHQLGHTMNAKICPMKYSNLITNLISLAEPVVAKPADDSANEPADEPADELAHSSTICDSPRAIYLRYIAARNIWYKQQPAGSIKTNQVYRRANSLPLRYPKSSYEWCLDYKHMGKCRPGKDKQPWTKEEMMAYLDWSHAEDARTEQAVQRDIEANGFLIRVRGPGYVWAEVERDIEQQNRLHNSM